jgi:hypothetical protein
MRLVVMVSTLTAVAVAAGLAVAQPKKDDKKGPGAGSGSAATAGTGSAARPGAGTGSAARPGAGTGSATPLGSGSGSAAVAPVPPEPPKDPDEVDVDSLRQEYLKLRDELFASRARAATVASALYSTKISLKLTYTSGRMYGVSRASIRLDGADVYDNTAGAIATDDGVRFEGYIAPGRHVLTFRVEAGGKDDPRFTTAVESTVVIQAVAGKDLFVSGRASDGGDIAYQWKKKEHGTYKLGLDIDVKSVKRPVPKAAAKGRSDATASR